MMESIYLVETEDDFSRQAQQCLEQAGYAVWKLTATAAFEAGLRTAPSLILIPTALRDGNGLDLCRSIRRDVTLCKIPIMLFLNGSEDRIAGLEAGADDCIAVPFSASELGSRVQELLNRWGAPWRSSAVNPIDLVIDTAAMKVSVRGSEVSITALEFRLLDYLARHRGHVFSRDALLDAVWGEMQFVTPRSVDACIRRVRTKIEPDKSRPMFLKTVRGVGYRFDGVAEWFLSKDKCECEACVKSSTSSRSYRPGIPKKARTAYAV